MSEGKTRRTSGEGGALDAALAAWPMPAREASQWERSAEGVLSLIATGKSAQPDASSLSDEDLLRAPLPASAEELQRTGLVEAPEEGGGRSPESRERKRASFRDLAKLASRSAPPAGPVSSGAASGAAPETAQNHRSLHPIPAPAGIVRLHRRRRSLSPCGEGLNIS